jgi:hypothetical protein
MPMIDFTALGSAIKDAMAKKDREKDNPTPASERGFVPNYDDNNSPGFIFGAPEPPNPPKVDDTAQNTALTPPNNGGQPTTPTPAQGGLVLQHNPKIDDLINQWQADKGVLQSAPPQEEQPNPIESIAALLGSLGTLGHGGGGIAAQHYADALVKDQQLNRAQQLSDWEGQKKAAQLSMGSTVDLLGHLSNPDGAADRVMQAMETTRMNTTAKIVVAGMKDNTTLTKSMASLYGDGKLTPQSMATLLQQESLNRGEAIDNNAALNAANDWFRNAQPSDWLKLKQQAQKDVEAKQSETDRENLRKVISNSNTPPLQKAQYMRQLRDMPGSIDYHNPDGSIMSDADIQTVANQQTSRQRYQEAEAYLATQRGDQVKYLTPLIGAAKAAYVAGVAADIAHKANMDQHMSDMLTFQEREANRRDAMSQGSLAIKALQGEYGQAEKEMLQAQSELAGAQKTLTVLYASGKKDGSAEVENQRKLIGNLTMKINGFDPSTMPLGVGENLPAVPGLRSKMDSISKQADDIRLNLGRMGVDPSSLNQPDVTPTQPGNYHDAESSVHLANAQAVLSSAIIHAGAGQDCSSFVGGVYKQLGVSLPRSAVEQYKATTPVLPAGKSVDTSKLLPGDLLFWDNGLENSKDPERAKRNSVGKQVDGGYVNHVAIYLGGGRIAYNQGAPGKQTTADVADMVNRYKFMGAGRVSQLSEQGTQQQPKHYNYKVIKQ